ncbi:hypothetical protein CCO03_14550 [Comamonas serinivorans]|uniref:Uncharacterized protein n=2 Tax=Comamonas serinivorans TaxID=1082851 RepID=A0A1Y0EQ57_9BURK|nr:hypothetical protein CCO03_14550 [Comamonas serinivorans]
MGVSITPDSKQRADTPGQWWPHATLRHMGRGENWPPISHPQACASQDEADAVALRLAKRHIREALHQG